MRACVPVPIDQLPLAYFKRTGRSQRVVFPIVHDSRKIMGLVIRFPCRRPLLNKLLQIELRAGSVLKQEAVDGAIEQMVFTDGALNLKLLGGSAAELGTAADS